MVVGQSFTYFLLLEGEWRSGSLQKSVYNFHIYIYIHAPGMVPIIYSLNPKPYMFTPHHKPELEP